MYKDRPQSHQLAYSAVTTITTGSNGTSQQYKVKYRNQQLLKQPLTKNNTLKIDNSNNADLAFLRNTVGPSRNTNASDLLSTTGADVRKVDVSLRQTMNITTNNVKDLLFRSPTQKLQKRSTRAETVNQSHLSDKNDKRQPQQNDRLQKIMNKYDKKNQTQQALKLLEQLKQLKRKQEELKKQRNKQPQSITITIKQSDQLVIKRDQPSFGNTNNTKQFQQTHIKPSTTLNYDININSPPPTTTTSNNNNNFSKKNRVDYYTPSSSGGGYGYNNKSQSTYPRSPQQGISSGYQRQKKGSYDFTADSNSMLINVNSQPYTNNSNQRSSQRQSPSFMQQQSNQSLNNNSNLSKSTSNLRNYYQNSNIGGTTNKKSSFAKQSSVKEYLSSSTVTDNKYGNNEKDYNRPSTSYKTADQYTRVNTSNSYKDSNNNYQSTYSKSPTAKYASTKQSSFSNSVVMSSKYSSTSSKYDNNSFTTPTITYSSTPLRDVFNNRKVTINDFHLGRTLGEGKFGTVYQAYQKRTKSVYALKKIPKSVIKSNFMIDQFILQVKLQQYCNHPNILTLHGCFDDSEHVYILLQYMDQGTLFLHLKKNSTLGQKQAAIKVKQMASAIQYLHENGIAHRDLKPQNIVMSHGVCKLCDFGWATICDERRKTYCGTFDYAAPQILQGEEYDMSVDLWCLGILAYQILVGKAPFYHISRKQTMKKIMNCENEKINYPNSMSYQARSFIEQLLKRNPEQRLKSQDLLKHPFILLADK